MRELTARPTHCQSQQEIIDRVNRYVAGWVNYFHVHTSTRVFTRLRYFLERRMIKYLRERRQLKGVRSAQWPASRLYKEFGMVAIPVHARHRSTRMP